MTRRTGSLPIYCVVSLFLLISSANAAILSFQFSGNVTQVPLDDVFGDIAVGDTIRGSYSFDTSAVDLLPADATIGSFTWAAPFGMTVAVGTHNFRTSGSLNIGILDSFVDQYTVLALSATGDLALELLLQDNMSGVFTDDRLPLISPLLADFAQKDFHLHALLPGGEIQVDGQLSTPQTVPEPSLTGSLLMGSLLAVLACRKRLLQFN